MVRIQQATRVFPSVDAAQDTYLSIKGAHDRMLSETKPYVDKFKSALQILV